MIDGEILGNGTSRLARSVSNIKELCPTYESFLEALIAGTLPLDILFNAEGWSQLPDFLNKENLLKDKTATLFGLDKTAVPNDAFERTAFSIPSKYGVIAFRCTKSDGSPSPFSASISPAIIDGSLLTTNEDGFYVGYAEPGNYKISIQTSGFVNALPSEVQVSVVSRRAVFTEFTVDPVEHGEMIVESSKTIAIPESLSTTIDIFAVGGGASGAAAASRTSTNVLAAGGGGGYTATKKGVSAAGKKIKVEIGAGGDKVSATTSGTGTYTGAVFEDGNDGGNTIVSLDDSVILTANGGKAGRGATSVQTRHANGGDGGSGGGGGFSTSSIPANGGSDGSDGLPADNDDGGGKGQGKTTTKFGENEGTKYSPGGGGVRVDNSSTCFGWPGGEDGGSEGKAVSDTSSSPSSISAAASKTPGAGGGACGLKAKNSTIDITATSAAGCKGIVILRW